MLRQLVDERDLAICLVEHDVSLVMGTCELIHVLDYGEIIASGTPEQVKNDPAVVNAYLGAPVSAVAPRSSSSATSGPATDRSRSCTG